MRKEVVYSLLAATAFPGIAQANINVVVNTNNWRAEAGSISNRTDNSVTVSAGGSIVQTIGTFIKGNYKLIVNDINTSKGNVQVSVAGKSVQTTSQATGQSVAIEFTLDAEQEVTITVASLNASEFTIGKSTITVINSFDKEAGALRSELTKATNGINAYGENGNKVYDEQPMPSAVVADYINQYADIDELIEKIEKEGEVSYETYKSVLYNFDKANNPVIAAIDSVWNAAAFAYEAQLIGSIKKSAAYADAIAAYDSIKTNSRLEAKVSALKTQLDKDVADYEADTKNASANGTAMNYDYITNLGKIKDDITALSDTIVKVNAADAANRRAYNNVNSLAENAKGTYTTTITVAFAEEKTPFPYTNLKKAALNAVSDLTAKLDDIKGKNLNSYNNETALADSVGYKEQIDSIGRLLESTTSEYITTLKGALDNLRNTYTDNKTKADNAKARYDASILSTHSEEVDALDSAVKVLEDKIGVANSGDCKSLNGLSTSSEVSAIASAITSLNAACQGDQAKADAVSKANKDIASLGAYFQTAKDSVATLKYGSEFAKESNWPNWETNIQKFIDTNIVKPASEKGADKKVAATDAFYTTTLPKQINNAKDSIDEYVRETSEAATAIASFDAEIKIASDSLASGYSKVGQLDIYTDKSQNHDGYDYKDIYTKASDALNAATKARVAAVAKKDKENTAAVKVLIFSSEAAVDFAKNVNMYAESDQERWTLAQTILAAKARQKSALYSDSVLRANAQMVDDSIRSVNKPLGLAKDSIQKLLNDVVIPEDTERNAAAADNATAETINAFYKKVAEATKKMEAILEYFYSTIEKVKATRETQSVANAAVAELDWANQEVAIKKAAGHEDEKGEAVDSYTYGKMSPKKESEQVDSLISDISSAIVAVNARINETAKAETIAKGYGNVYNDSIKGEIAVIGDLIDSAVEKAGILKNNYTNYKLLDKAAGEVTDSFETAKKAAKDKGGQVGTDFYANRYVDVYLKDIADTLNANILMAYYGQELINKNAKNALDNRIIKLKGELDSIGSYALKNLNAYNALVKTAAEVQETWNSQSTLLASKDESSNRETHQAWMAEKLAEYKRIVSEVESNYGIGGFDERNTYSQTISEIRGTSTKGLQTTESDKFNAIKNEVVDSVAKWIDPDTYNAQIAADNNTMLLRIAKARDNAKDAYRIAAAHVDNYRNITNSELKKSIQDIYDSQNSYLNPKPNQIDSIYKAADAEKVAVALTPGVVFDKDGNYVNALNEIAADIVNKDTTFINDVKDKLGSYASQSISKYEKDRDDAQDVINTYTLTQPVTDKTNALQDVNALIAQAKDAIGAANVSDLDNALNQLLNIDNMLKADMNDAAALDLKVPLNNAEDTVALGRAFLTGDDLNKFNEQVSTSIAKARTLYDSSLADSSMAVEYLNIRGYIERFNNDNLYKTRLDNNVAADSLQLLINMQVQAIAAARQSVAAYSVAPDLETMKSPSGFERIESDLDIYQRKVNRVRTGKYNSIELLARKIRSISQSIANLIAQSKATNGNLYVKEKEYVDNRLSEFNALYVQYAAQDADAAAPYKVTIDNMTALVNSADSAYKLLPYEKVIKDSMTLLVNESGNNAINAAVATLDSLLGEVGAIYDGIIVSEDIKDYYVEEASERESKYSDLVSRKETLKKQIGALEEEIAKSSNALYDKDMIVVEINNVKSDAGSLDENVSSANKVTADNKAKDEAMLAEFKKQLKDVRDNIDNSKTDIDKKFDSPYAKSDKYTSQYALCEKSYVTMANKVDELKNKKMAWMMNDNFLDKDSSDIQDVIDDIKANAVYQQALADQTDIREEIDDYHSIVYGTGAGTSGNPYLYNDPLYFTSDGCKANRTNYGNINVPDVRVGRPTFDGYTDWRKENVVNMRDSIKTALNEFWKNILSVPSSYFNDIKDNAETGNQKNLYYDLDGDGDVNIFDIQTAIKKGIR